MRLFVKTIILLLLLISPAWATTYYVRTDGSTAANCTGLVDAAYPGSGTSQSCAVNSPLWILRFNGTTSPDSVFVGGDTMIIDGDYEISADAEGAGYGTECNPTYSYDCRWKIPAGPDADHPTRILGKGYDTATSYADAPKLTGKGGIYRGVLEFDGADNIEIQYLDITDGEACQGGFDTPSVECTEGNAANNAIWSEGSDNILLKNINMHGLAARCIMFSGASNWDFENVLCRGAGFAGLDSDSPYQTTADAQSGTMTVNNFEVEYIGCVENLDGTIQSASCVGQGGSYWHGYADAFGFTSDSPGTMANWEINNLSCHDVMQDCFDGLHGDGSGYLKIKNSLFYDINGASIKTVNPVTTENTIVIDNCTWAYEMGMMYTDGSHDSDMLICRADAAVSIGVVAGGTYKFINSTFFSNHNQIFSFFGSDGCAGSSVYLRNNIVQGGADAQNDTTHPYGGFTGTGDNKTDSYYVYSSGGSGCGGLTVDEDYNTFYNTKDGAGDVSGSHSYYRDPGLVGTIKTGPYNTVGYYTTNPVSTFYLGASSNMRYEVGGANTADETVSCWDDCSTDYNSFDRGANYDTGALEYGSVPTAAGDPCTAQTISNCDLSASDDGETSGTCSSGYTGSCSYSCSDGSWVLVSNSCSSSEGNTLRGTWYLQ